MVRDSPLGTLLSTHDTGRPHHAPVTPLPIWTAAHPCQMASSASPHVPGAQLACFEYAVDIRTPKHDARKGWRTALSGIHRFPQEVKIMHIQPLGDRVVVKPKPKEERTKGGIYLPDTATKERPSQGTVMA